MKFISLLVPGSLDIPSANSIAPGGLLLPSMDDKKPFEFYKYEPSLAAAIVFAVLFLISSVLHTIQLVRTRTWYFTPLVIGGVMEGIGFVGRIMSSRETPKWTLGPFIIQSILLLVAPALFAASIYMVLGRIIIAIDGEGFSVIKKRWLTKLFVAGDILSFLVLSSGTCDDASSPSFRCIIVPFSILLCF